MSTNDTNRIVVRMAPSPTGNLHVGTARTTLFNYLFARKHGGKFVLRVEDTDKERSTKEYEDNILEGLKWLGLEHDEFYRQSERIDVYKKHLNKMLESGAVYVSQEEPKEEGQRSEVIRFKNQNKMVAFDDLVRGTVEFDTTELGDFVVARSEDEPLYHLAVVIDDHEMGITHVIRGEDHISNTARQILIQEAIGAERPVYAHIPLLLASDRKKLSKRAHGEAVWVDTYRKEGYLPEALNNYLALLGWNPGTDEEIFSMEELIEKFDIAQVQKGGAIFDEKKLRWVNKEQVKKFRSLEVAKLIKEKLEAKYDTKIHDKLVEIVFERVEVLSDVDQMLEAGELDYFFKEPVLDPTKISWKQTPKEETIKHLEEVRELVGNLDEIMLYAEREGKGNVLWPLRYSLSGEERSPDPFTLMEVLGVDRSVARINKAIELLK